MKMRIGASNRALGDKDKGDSGKYLKAHCDCGYCGDGIDVIEQKSWTPRLLARVSDSAPHTKLGLSSEDRVRACSGLLVSTSVPELQIGTFADTSLDQCSPH